MILYAMIMFAVAAIFGVVAVQLYRGKTELVHDYHQTRVQDKAGYGKAFGKAMAVMAVAMALSGVISLFGERIAWLSVAALASGLTAGIVAIVRVQKKYNGGVF